MKEDLIAYDNYYQTIDNYLFKSLNDYWKILTEGKEKIDNKFQVEKRIINMNKNKKISI